jgi:hypothetical protein
MVQQTKAPERKSSTRDRQMSFYPTPQNQSKIKKFISENSHKGAYISKNRLINDAVEEYLAKIRVEKK